MAYRGGFDSRTDYTKEERRAARAATLGKGVLLAEPGVGEAEAARLGAAAVRIEALLAAAGSTIPSSEEPRPVGRRGLEAGPASLPAVFGTALVNLSSQSRRAGTPAPLPIRRAPRSRPTSNHRSIAAIAALSH